MPELPEIETLRRSLEPRLEDARIERVTIHRTDLREPVPTAQLEALEGARIRRLHRRAKYLLIELADTGRTILIHLGMSGRFELVPRTAQRAPHEHLAFEIGPAGGGPVAEPQRLRLVDPRRFGLVAVADTHRLDEDRHLRHLGPEPLDVALTAEGLRAIGRSRRTPIKSFLMDAEVVVGIGNIYASEILWLGRVHPQRKAGRVGIETWRRLVEAIRSVLGEAIERGGSTLRDFVDGEGRSGSYQTGARVYDREGRPCPRCGTPIRRRVLAGRSTYYCVRCQH